MESNLLLEQTISFINDFPLRLSNVFLVPKLAANLIFVGQLVDEGNKVTLLLMVVSFRSSTLGRRKQRGIGLDVSLQWISEELDL